MAWAFSGDKPIYTQLVERLAAGIAAGELPPGGRLPTVRELAAEAAVNPNTVQRAYNELENRGLVYAQRTAGRFVTQDRARVAALRRGLAAEKARRFLRELGQLGFTRQEAIRLLAETETQTQTQAEAEAKAKVKAEAEAEAKAEAEAEADGRPVEREGTAQTSRAAQEKKEAQE